MNGFQDVTKVVWRALRGERGMSAPVHRPVLVEEVLAAIGALRGAGLEGWIVDATVGAGGHARAILEHFPRAMVLGTDQDPEILALAAERLTPFGERARLERCRLSQVARLVRKLRVGRPVAMLVDLGASSLQLDRPERGFSFLHDGPLDMRMDPERERTAADIVNGWDEEDLADLFYYEGGERGARRVARAIVESRRRAPFRRTGALAELIARTLGHGSGRLHPATRTFQALRRAVNEEGEELATGLAGAECSLADGGVLAVVSFHSGEDGAVKRFLAAGAAQGRWRVPERKPVRPGRLEEGENPRARSARLRWAIRTRLEGEEPACAGSGGAPA